MALLCLFKVRYSLSLTPVTTTVAIYTTYGTSNSNSTDVGAAVNLTWWDPSGL